MIQAFHRAYRPKFKKTLAGTLGQRFESQLKSLPHASNTLHPNKEGWVTILNDKEIDESLKTSYLNCANAFKPWRKGPFQVNDIRIDSEWNSDLKWNRLVKHISIKGKKLLDVGCGNGYYMLRALEYDPYAVIGIDPSVLYWAQYKFLTHGLTVPPPEFYMCTLEELYPYSKSNFDTVLCLGVLYHRRSPLDTLKQLNHVLRANGELILETLVIPGEDAIALSPKDRYAQMNNISFIPTVKCLIHWLEKTGFAKPEVISIDRTTEEEQRTTGWSNPVSLNAFLDPQDSDKTIEGYPAPIRCCIKVKKKS
ncbi:tRNA 5-methoxyuridine(34)/uridine 5-oxyacetic acid(34) synthase CmoB [bacterium]|jgi:tRNA (mo5U34)-methyltransferase|nr:tRNA 5-methoxyuridine(34)/uridine 5-oxyacetic acid(34) synthase CmoB [bacterium]